MTKESIRFPKKAKLGWPVITVVALLLVAISSGSTAVGSKYGLPEVALQPVKGWSQDRIPAEPGDMRILPNDQVWQPAISEREGSLSLPLSSVSEGMWAGYFGPPSQYGTVYAVAVGSHGQIYVGGIFGNFGVSANNIAMWDGSSWSALGSGLNGRVYALVIDSSGNLYAGGIFDIAGEVEVDNIAMWDGSSWSALGDGLNGVVGALAVDGAGNLYAGGKFDIAGEAEVDNIAMWDGSSWWALGSGLGIVNTLAIDAVGDLYAGGGFTMAGDVTVNHIAKWDGSAWSSLGSGLGGGDPPPSVHALAVDSLGHLYAGGRFYTAGGVTAKFAARWDGSSWSGLGAGLGGGDEYSFGYSVTGVFALTLDDAGDLYAGGNFTTAGDAGANKVARWDRTSWSALREKNPLDNGMGGQINALAIDGSGNLYAGGALTRAGYQVINDIARWDGINWYGGGSPYRYDEVTDLTVDSSGVRYAAKIIWPRRSYSIGHSRIWQWDECCSSSLAVWEWDTLYLNEKAITIYDLAVDHTGNLYVAGNFDTIEDVPANYIAKWDGSSWSALGSGTNGLVNSLAVADNGDLYAGGNFTMAGDVTANYIAVWNGSAWSALTSETNDYVHHLKFDSDGNLYAGGWFTAAGGARTNYIAKWDGTVWSALGSGMNSAVNKITIGDEGILYAGGTFTIAGEVNANYVAMWDGSDWLPLDSGIGGTSPTVNDLELDAAGNLYVGGSFSTAGGIPSANIAKWVNLRYAVLLPSVAK